MRTLASGSTLVSVYLRSDGAWHAGAYRAGDESVNLGDFDSPLHAQAAAEQWIAANATVTPDSGWRVSQLEKWVDEREVG